MLSIPENENINKKRNKPENENINELINEKG